LVVRSFAGVFVVDLRRVAALVVFFLTVGTRHF
jgi:hypothetical protein